MTTPTIPGPATTRVEAVKAKLAEKPPEKRRNEAIQIMWGLPFLAFAWIGRSKFPGVSDYVFLGIGGLGVVMCGGEYVQYPFRKFLANLGDLLDKIRGRAPAGEP